MSRYEKSSVIRADARKLFEFFLDPRNLPRISPPGFELLDLEATIPLTAGAEFFLKARLGSRTISWHGRVVHWEPPRLLQDEQVSGPFRRFIHVHQFRAIGDHTLVIDQIEYQPPFGLLGAVADALVIRRQLREMFEYRHRRLRELFESPQ